MPLIIAAALDQFDPHGADHDDFMQFDTNHDGDLTAADCPFTPGGPEARVWWDKVMEPYAHQAGTAEMKAKYGDDLLGAYMGKPLVPGQAGPGEADFQFLVHKLMVRQGLSQAQATKIASSYNTRHYG